VKRRDKLKNIEEANKRLLGESSYEERWASGADKTGQTDMFTQKSRGDYLALREETKNKIKEQFGGRLIQSLKDMNELSKLEDEISSTLRQSENGSVRAGAVDEFMPNLGLYDSFDALHEYVLSLDLEVDEELGRSLYGDDYDEYIK
jgi:hypothetical protein